MIYIAKVLVYCLFASLVFYYSKESKIRILITGKRSRKEKPKISWSRITVFSFLFGLYSVFVTTIPYWSDRKYYAGRFAGNWVEPFTFGLNRVADFVHLFTNDPRALFFAVSFLSCFFLLYAYRISREGDRNSILILLSSNLLILSFHLLKQAPAMSFAAISIVYMLRKKYISAFTFCFISILFHESAFILIPMLILCIGSNKKWIRVSAYILMATSIIAFSGLTRYSFSLIARWLPNLLEESIDYLDTSGAMRSGEGNYVTMVKGAPYYIATVYGLYKRPYLKNNISDYDTYLIMSAFSSVTSILSSYMYWMFRFGAFFYFPCFVFCSEIYRADTDRRNASVFLYSIVLLHAFFTIRYLLQVFFWYGGF